MIVGSLQVRLLVREARSLKDKRQVLQSIKDRLRNQFNVSVAEVDAQEHRQMIVPPELSRRETYPDGLSPKDTLHYDIELVGIQPQ